MSVNYFEEASFIDDEAQVNIGDVQPVSKIGDVGKSISGAESHTDTDTATASTHRHPKEIAQDEKAIVEEEIRPGEPGRVRFQSTWWPAISDQEINFKPGEAVRVVAIENVTLIVEG